MKLADAKTKLFELAESPALENRRDSLLELAGALDSDKAHLWAKVDLFAAFGEDSVSVPKADSRDRQIVWFEWARNLLVLVPLVITWLGVWLASREYGELTRAAGEDERLREISTRPFIALWEQGFQVPGFEGGTWFSLTKVALLDMTAIALVIVVSFIVGALRVSREVGIERQYQETWNDLREALTEASYHLAASAFDTPAKVTEELGRATEKLASITDHVIATEERAGHRHDQISRSIDVFNERLDAHGQVLAGLNATAAQARDGLLGIQTEFGRASDAFTTLGSKQGDLLAQLEMTAGRLEAVATGAQNHADGLTAAVHRLLTALADEGLTRIGEELRGSAAALQTGVDALQRQMDERSENTTQFSDEVREVANRMEGHSNQLLDQVGGVAGALQEVRDLDSQLVTGIEQLVTLLEELARNVSLSENSSPLLQPGTENPGRRRRRRRRRRR